MTVKNTTIELTREETFLLEMILEDEKKECIKRYDSFQRRRDSLTYPKNAEASFLRILGRLDTLIKKVKKNKV